MSSTYKGTLSCPIFDGRAARVVICHRQSSNYKFSAFTECGVLCAIGSDTKKLSNKYEVIHFVILIFQLSSTKERGKNVTSMETIHRNEKYFNYKYVGSKLVAINTVIQGKAQNTTVSLIISN